MSGRDPDLACTAYRLRKAARRVTQAYEAALAESGVSIVQFAVLAELDRSEALTLSALADRLATDRTTLSRTVDRMSALGWTGSVPAQDRRERRLNLTDAGKAAFAGALPAWQRVECTIARNLGSERRDQLWTMLKDLDDVLVAVEDAGEGEPSDAMARP
ncbi:MarR family winged helix-turn-helix transcriptional regulator [Amorphus sp. 3PC139-8]|uniref:MarR family winged helix-turn-helix transcriptional regulator n=1 Tax=Amorphus sp. 3PC139-8 TaxID=2735676 RepID=UPI00345D0F9A